MHFRLILTRLGLEGLRFVFGSSWSWKKCSWSRRGQLRLFLKNFYPKQACTGLQVLSRPVSFKSESFCSACTGLQVSHRPVSLQSVSTLQLGTGPQVSHGPVPVASEKKFWEGTGPQVLRGPVPPRSETWFEGGYRSTEKAETGPCQVRDLSCRRVPVYAKHGDRSLCLISGNH